MILHLTKMRQKMAVSRMPDEELYKQKIIAKGVDDSIEDKEQYKEQYVITSIRFPKSFLQLIDKYKAKKIGLTRNAAVLQLLQKALEIETL